MSEWLVKLEGHEFDLIELSRQLTGPELSVTKDGDSFWLRSIEFALFTDANDVHAVAAKLLQRINGAARAFSGDYRPVRQAGIERQHDDGRREMFNFGQAILAQGRSMVTATGTVSGSAPQPRHVEPSNVAFATLHAEQDETVQRALRIFGGRDHDWVNLYRVYEIVRADVTAEVWKLGWASKAEISRFTGTANHPSVVGDDARHGHLPERPLSNPMTLDEAQSLIRRLLMAWINSKRSAP